MCTLQLIKAETSIQYSSQIRAIVYNDHEKIIFLFILFLGLYIYITQNKMNILGLTRQHKIVWKSGRKFILKFSPQADFNFVQPWITWSISWVGWQIHSLSIHGWFHKINVTLVHIWKVFFTLYVTVCTRVMVVNEFWTYSAIVCYQSTWYLYLYLIEKVLDVLDAIQVLWVLVLVLELANFKSTCTWLKYFRKYLTPTLVLS